MDAVNVLAPDVGMARACGALRVPRTGVYRDDARRRLLCALGFLKTAAIGWEFLTGQSVTTVPCVPIPVRSLTSAALLNAPGGSLYRLGHSTALLKLDGDFWLTDPVFSERASPIQWAGLKRFHPPPISIEELPPIKRVILSHDHFDHLERVAIMKLAQKVAFFVAPLGDGERRIA